MSSCAQSVGGARVGNVHVVTRPRALAKQDPGLWKQLLKSWSLSRSPPCSPQGSGSEQAISSSGCEGVFLGLPAAQRRGASLPSVPGT